MAHRYGGSYGRNGADPSAYSLAQGLGWFSIGLGMAEVLAPGHLARFLGMEERTELIRAYGAREIMSGIGILSQEDPTPWIWGSSRRRRRRPRDPRHTSGRRQSAPAKRDGRRGRGGRRHGAGCDLRSTAEQATPHSRREPAPAASERLQQPARHARLTGSHARRCERLKSAGGHADSGGLAPLHHKKFA